MVWVSPAMDWWKDNFWLILAVTIIIVSMGLGLILFFVCRRQLRQGKEWKITRSLRRNQREEETMYENVLNQVPAQLPPLPLRDLPSPELSSPRETPVQPPVTYSSLHKVRNTKTASIPSSIEYEDDYDDVEIPTTIGNHQFETTISSFCQAEKGSRSVF
ncbi:SLP adapter and CSK-interacting membrane protein [Echinops telfairi]|uniref:SLP adapter and CSK-interacting membrane protein n=1 Tax=Echinops telfairi TaxID=9371 RepID=A0ABM0ZTM7_ECHTE|nr:SLP adapter and CSK-interacting membrane protein [Echinops telfairi]